MKYCLANQGNTLLFLKNVLAIPIHYSKMYCITVLAIQVLHYFKALPSSVHGSKMPSGEKMLFCCHSLDERGVKWEGQFFDSQIKYVSKSSMTFLEFSSILDFLLVLNRKKDLHSRNGAASLVKKRGYRIEKTLDFL